MRSIAPLFTGFALTFTVACIGAAPARAGGDISIRPASARPGDLVTVRLRCAPETTSGRVNGPTSFGAVPADRFDGGVFERDVRVPERTRKGPHAVFGFCGDSTKSGTKTGTMGLYRVVPAGEPLLGGGLARPSDTPEPGEGRAKSSRGGGGLSGLPLFSSGRPGGQPKSGAGRPGKRRVGEHRSHRPRPAGDRQRAFPRAKNGRATEREEFLSRAFAKQTGDISRALTGRSDGLPQLTPDRMAKINRLLGGRPSPIGFWPGGMR
ncbi:hypothetical protein [Nonomuraea longicatena]|uniref:Uncharacterized protein n=1 Tax=Nonomuraea longicatena TaxID=83682 RepID=A0ABP3ZFG6_9ACTN